MTNKFTLVLAGLVLASLLLFPEIKISDDLPTFQLVDFLMPIVVFFLFIKRKEIKWNIYFGILVSFSIVMGISIIINGRTNELRDYFEFYKLLKFSTIILLFSLVLLDEFIKYIGKPVFIILVTANLFHYFNLFDINNIIHSYYNGGIHIETFGLNSLGQPATRRMLGFSSNPNINSIVFGFFAILFIPQKDKKSIKYLWFITAVFMMFLCQSRTNFIAFVVMIILTFLIVKRVYNFNVKKIILSVLIGYLLAFLLAQNVYLNSLFSGEITQNKSLLGRFEVWKHLFEMILQKPFFGHAPYKEYFYQNNLYSENEYIMQTWRYGFIGLIVFLGVLFYPALKTIGKLSNKKSLILFQFTILVSINSLTNNPFSDRLILILFAVAIGLSYDRKKLLEDAK